jgi:hypothetical protein
MKVRNTAGVFGVLLVLAALAPAAPAYAALPLPRVSGNDIAPAGPQVEPNRRARRGCVFGVFPAGHGRCFAATPVSVVS